MNFLSLPLFGALSEPFGGVTRRDKRDLSSSSPPQSSAQDLFQGSPHTIAGFSHFHHLSLSMATYFLQYGLQMLNSLRNTSTTVYPCFSLFLGSHRLGTLPFSLRAMSESKAHDQGHVVQFLWSLVRLLAYLEFFGMLTWDFGAIFEVHGTGILVAALLPPYWHEAHLDKRQEQSILRRYPVPDHGAVVGQGSAPKRTCTVPPDACARRCLPWKEHGPAFMRFPPAPALPARSTECPVSAAPRMQAIPVLSSHRRYSPRSFETSYGGSREAGKRRHIARCAHTWREFRSSSKAKPGALPASAHRRSGGQRQGYLAAHCKRVLSASPSRGCAGMSQDARRRGCAGSAGPARKMSYPVEAQFQQSDGAWSVCARPRSGARDAPRSTSCAPAATTPAQTSTWAGPVGPADGVAGPRGAEGYTHPYSGPVRRSVSGVYWELHPAQWACARGRGSASRGLQYGIGPSHFHPTTAHVPHGRRLPVEAKNSSSRSGYIAALRRSEVVQRWATKMIRTLSSHPKFHSLGRVLDGAEIDISSAGESESAGTGNTRGERDDVEMNS
ncbi:hypothetical protein DFH08DRAFT_945639 [Mycena albidolilacea]|uniref:Uncharacterized protein n=1 Tax=Mycena albidolilacea TaxID=1033008 RepID=A0AAD6YZW7_9AGAR|nr:hypothetical protein DFH08DRAFT_945639 [Mycena albidolilacea]